MISSRNRSGVLLALILTFTVAQSSFDVQGFCKDRCMRGSGGVLCQCNAFHFAGKRTRGPTSPSLSLSSSPLAQAAPLRLSAGAGNNDNVGDDTEKDDLSFPDQLDTDYNPVTAPRPRYPSTDSLPPYSIGYPGKAPFNAAPGIQEDGIEAARQAAFQWANKASLSRHPPSVLADGWPSSGPGPYLYPGNSGDNAGTDGDGYGSESSLDEDLYNYGTSRYLLAELRKASEAESGSIHRRASLGSLPYIILKQFKKLDNGDDGEVVLDQLEELGSNPEPPATIKDGQLSTEHEGKLSQLHQVLSQAYRKRLLPLRRSTRSSASGHPA